MMIKIFSHNHFEVNCTLAFDESKECILIDVCPQTSQEQKEITDFIKKNELKVKHILLTHAHIDHLCGARWATQEFNLPLELHKDGEAMFKMAETQASMMGFNVSDIDKVELKYICEKDIIEYGNSKMQVIDVPGHCAGSLCFYNEKEGFIVTGDALFAGSIGRTDLPSGDYDLLLKNIMTKLMPLDEKTICICGHGPNTTIGFEKENNPFLFGR